MISKKHNDNDNNDNDNDNNNNNNVEIHCIAWNWVAIRSMCVFHSHLHLSTPTPVLTGNGLAGFFSPITLRVLKSSLSMLGWVCSWIALLVVFCSSSLIDVKLSSINIECEQHPT